MLIEFRKSLLYKNAICSSYYEACCRYRDYGYTSILLVNETKSIRKILKENFKSVLFINNKKAVFNFSDPDDEAFFLVWSSDGIEI